MDTTDILELLGIKQDIENIFTDRSSQNPFYSLNIYVFSAMQFSLASVLGRMEVVKVHQDNSCLSALVSIFL